MATVHTVSGGFTDAPGKIMSFETGKLAGQADGAVVARLRCSASGPGSSRSPTSLRFCVHPAFGKAGR